MIPFTAPESQFLEMLLEQGTIQADLLTDDEQLQHRIAEHPMLLWKALNVRKHKQID